MNFTGRPYRRRRVSSRGLAKSNERGQDVFMAYVFDPDIVHECSLTAINHGARRSRADKPKPAMFDAFAQAMEEEYPGRLDFDQPWIFSNAGGAMIQMKLYYASIFEYIMIWGTPIGSEGHS